MRHADAPCHAPGLLTPLPGPCSGPRCCSTRRPAPRRAEHTPSFQPPAPPHTRETSWAHARPLRSRLRHASLPLTASLLQRGTLSPAQATGEAAPAKPDAQPRTRRRRGSGAQPAAAHETVSRPLSSLPALGAPHVELRRRQLRGAATYELFAGGSTDRPEGAGGMRNVGWTML